MRPMGINKISDLKKLSQIDLEGMFGKVGTYFYERSQGIDRDPVVSDNEVKSIGKEHTFEADTRDSENIFKVFDVLIKAVYE